MKLELKTHASLGASSADRWMHCAASVRLSEGLPATDTEHTRLGTAAHALLEMALKKSLPPSTWLGMTVEGCEVTEEMCEAVQVAVDVVAAMHTPALASTLWIERRFDLNALNPPSEMYGTSDIVIYQQANRRLVVVDYKHGQGYAVAAKGNPQLRYYGLGALLEIEKEIGPGRIDTVELVIVQPRAAHPDGIIRREEIPYDALVDFAEELLTAAYRTLDPAAQPVTGPWCRWCKAQPICPAQHALAVETAQSDFAAPPAPETLPMDVLLNVLSKKAIVEAWLTSVAKYLESELAAGREVPGYKLVAKRAMRKWLPDAPVETRLREAGATDEEIYERKLKSVAQVEKVLGKKRLEAECADLIIKESSGVVLAPDYDPRPAVSAGPEHDFLPSPTVSQDIA